MNWHNQHVFWYRLHNLEILLFHIKKQVRILPEGFYNIGKEFSYIIKKCLRHFNPLAPIHGGIRGFFLCRFPS